MHPDQAKSQSIRSMGTPTRHRLSAAGRFRQACRTVGIVLTAIIVVAVAGITDVRAATRYVSNANDSGTGSLRQTIINATAGDTIQFNGDYTILLLSELAIGKNLTIDGTGRTITVSGNHVTRVFNVTAGTVVFKYLTIADGAVQTTDCAGLSYKCGGGIMLQNNGGIAVTVQNCTLSGNNAAFMGGGMYVTQGSLTVTGCTFTGNSSGNGGGIAHNTGGSLTLSNSTFNGNSASYGGGLSKVSTSGSVTNCTFVGNSASISGGGIAKVDIGTMSVNDTIVANSTAGGNCSMNGPSSFSGSNNLSSDATCGSVFTNSSTIRTGTLGNYGGTTSTMPLLPGSSAINAGSGCPATDQRGISRVGTCDIGAFESRGFALAKTGGDGQSASINTSFTTPLTVSVTSSYSEPVNGGQITFTPPASGAGANLSPNPATISGGSAAGNATANGTTGSYTVATGATGATSVNFSLTNTCYSSIVVTSSATSGAGSLRQAIAQVCPGGTITFDGDRTILLSSELGIDKTLTIDGSGNAVTVSGNHATRVFNISAGQVTVKNMTIADGYVQNRDCSSSRNCGGGMKLQNNAGIIVTILGCTFSGNSGHSDYSATFGGAIAQENGTLGVTNCTFSGNSVDYGGAISKTGGTLTLTNCTFTGNGSSVSDIDNRGGTVTASDTLIANRAAGTSNCYNAASMSGVNNLSDDGSCLGFSTSSTIRLGPLGSYGGTTKTVPLLIGSSAIDAGSNVTCAATDQRGIARPQNAYCDIGAYEMEAGYTETTLTTSLNPAKLGQEVTFTATVAAQYGTPTGEVQFSIDDVPFGAPVPLVGGQAATSTATQVVGIHLVVASYNGESTFLPSTSAGMNQLVCGDALTVTTANDSGAGSLREAISLACPGAVISFTADATIHLAGELVMDKNLTIDGLGHAVTLSGDSNNDGMCDVRVLTVNAGVSVVLNHLTVENGCPLSGSGGGLLLHGNAVLRDVHFNRNMAFPGGGIYSDGDLTVDGGTFSENYGNFGGGVAIFGGRAILDSVTLDSDAATYGGGIFNQSGDVTVTNSSIVNGQSQYGAGIANAGISSDTPGLMTVRNCTLSGNHASNTGGGILNYSNGNLTLGNTTIANGSGPTGGGLVNQGTLTIRNTISDNVSGADCINSGTITANVNNFMGDGTCSSLYSGDPTLGPLADNGGPTLTHALLTGSPAIDSGDDGSCPGTDQRGMARPAGNNCDIGAFEFGADLPINPPPVADGNSAGVAATFTRNGSDPDQIDVVYDALACSGSRSAILFGTIGDFSVYAGCAQNNAGFEGTTTIDAGGLNDVWFNIIWTSGWSGGHPGYGNDGTTDVERSWNAAGFCGLTDDDHTDPACN